MRRREVGGQHFDVRKASGTVGCHWQWELLRQPDDGISRGMRQRSRHILLSPGGVPTRPLLFLHGTGGGFMHTIRQSSRRGMGETVVISGLAQWLCSGPPLQARILDISRGVSLLLGARVIQRPADCFWFSFGGGSCEKARR